MEAAQRSRVFSEINPHCEWVRGNGFDTLLIDVTGFRKDQLKVQVDASSSLRISGERAIDGRQWCHFLKRFELSDGCDASTIRVQLDKGVLYIQVPNPSAPPASSEQNISGTPGEELRETETIWSSHAEQRNNQSSVWQLAKSLNKRKQVIFNIVLAIVLLWLVAFAKNNPSVGQIKNK